MSSDWQTGFFACFSDVGICCKTCWCPCVVVAETTKIINDDFCISCMFPSEHRIKVRSILGIEGSETEDCLLGNCFPYCAICQIARELKLNPPPPVFPGQQVVIAQPGQYSDNITNPNYPTQPY